MSLFNSPHIAGWPGHNAISHAAGWANQLAKRGSGGITWVTRHVPMQRWEKGRGRDRGGLGEGTRHKAAGGKGTGGVGK